MIHQPIETLDRVSFYGAINDSDGFHFYFSTPLGYVEIIGDESYIYQLQFNDNIDLEGKVTLNRFPLWMSPLFHQLNKYFKGEEILFSLPLLPKGTKYQMEVWQQMRLIPYGRTMTYGELASCLGYENGARAIGSAANKNPLPILIPCHRVIGGTGKMVGFGAGLEKKSALLKLEHAILL
tara:strand:+ start:100226 stop:100765 length:540 start_codon:yes stop_codon:yes gene_type:complete